LDDAAGVAKLDVADLSSDYDTQASFYGVKKASEMVHVQLDPSNDAVEVANSLPETKPGLTARARVYSLENKLLAEHEEKRMRRAEPRTFHAGPGAFLEGERGTGEIGVARFDREAGV